MCSLAKNKFFPFVIAIPLFFCMHSYRGIILDAILYLLQYISTFDPERFINDPPFAFGNQNSYGVFSPILGFFVESLGVAQGMKILCLLSHLGWVISAVFLVRAFSKYSYNKIWFIPFLIIFIVFTADGMPHTSVHFFRLVEHYTCSRAISIALAFGGLAALLCKKKFVSLLLFFVGTAIHPLTAGWGLPLWILFFFPKFKIPLLLFAVLFPFLVFLHVGKLDFLPLDWLQRPLTFAPPKDMIVRNCVWFIFFGYLIPRYFPKNPLVVLSKAIFWVTLIAFYWNLWGGFGEHIFLYQVQTWREEWIPMVFSLLFCFILATQLYKRIRKKKLETIEFSKFLTILAVMSPVCLFVPAVSAVFLDRKYRSHIDMAKFFMFCLAYFVIAGFLVQQYVIWGLEGGDAFLGFDYHYLYKLKNSLLLAQFVLAVINIALLVWRRRILNAVPLILFVLFPQFQLLPLCVIIWTMVKSNKKILFIAILILTLFDSLFNTLYRETSLLESLPSSFYKYCIFAVLSLLSIKMTTLLKRKVYFRFAPTALLVLMFGGLAYGNWDCRDDLRKEIEMKLDSFLKKSLFPQEKNRGRMFFYVNGPLESEPRLQFLSGAYLSETDHVGEIFFEGQYKETMKRENLLFYKEDRGIPHNSSDYVAFVLNKMSSRDTLIDRIQFLCEQDEIENLVSNEIAVPFEKKDSVLYDNSQWIYLYKCP